MPPDSRADGPGGPKARRTRGPASPGQRTAQPFGGTLNASPLRCAPGASVSRGRSAGTPQAAAHAGHRPPAGVRRPTRAAVHTGLQPSRAFRRPPAVRRRTRGASASRGGSAGTPQAAVHAGHWSSQAFRDPCGPPYTRGLGPPAGVPQASRRPPPHAGHRPPRGFRRSPAARRHTRGLGPRGRSAAHAARRTRGASALAGIPQASRRPPPHAGHRPPEGVPHASRRPRPPSPPPAARFSRKPPCGIGSRMVYCT